MTPSRYRVIGVAARRLSRAATGKSGNWTVGPISGHVRAIDAAMNFAGKNGKAGRAAKILCQRTEGRCEPFGFIGVTRTLAPQAIRQIAGH